METLFLFNYTDKTRPNFLDSFSYFDIATVIAY